MKEKFETKVSPEPREFSTGAVRGDATRKGRFDLIPTMMLHRWAQLMERGSIGYGDRNWERGIKLSSFQDSAMRHLVQLIEGDRTEDHAAAILFNVSGYEYTRAEILAGRLPAGLADGTAVRGEVIERTARVRAEIPPLSPHQFVTDVIQSRMNAAAQTRRPSDFASDGI